MLSKFKYRDKKYIAAAIVVHVILLFLVIVSFAPKTITPHSILNITHDKKDPDLKKIVQAIAISEQELNQEVERLEKLEQHKKEEADKKLKALQRKEREAVQHRAKEEEKLIALKKELSKAKQETLAQEEGKKLLQNNIAQEKAQLEKLRLEKEKLEKAKKEALAQQQKEAEEQEAKRQAQVAAHNALINKEVNKYIALIKHKVEKNWVKPQDNLGNLSSMMLIKTRESGEITEVRVAKSSGNPSFDRAAELAILKSSPLPMPSEADALVKFRVFNFTFKQPEE